MKTIRIALAALALALTNAAGAQDLQNQLIGTWDFAVAQVKAPDVWHVRDRRREEDGDVSHRLGFVPQLAG